MKRFLIFITVSLVVLCMVKGSSLGTENTSAELAVQKLNKVVDAQLLNRVQMLALGTELSLAINE